VSSSRKRNPVARGLWAVASCVLVMLLGAVGVPRVAEAADPLQVTVDTGVLKGRTDNGTRQFLGVPYAAPPVGPLRWTAPRPASSWSGVRNATSPGSQCAQTAGLPLSSTTNEDCLFLNVYVPAGGAPVKPVMVWIHGGAYSLGAADQYDPTELAKRGDVVVVAINYRLGPFGYLAHPALSAEATDRSSGDYGLMDQQAALRWVKRNVAAFGGDAANVTIFGESAGGSSVCSQVASPQAAGLFVRAIAESGCAFPAPTVATAERTGVKFATDLGCGASADRAVAACLRSKPAQDLLDKSGFSVTNMNLLWSPTAGGSILPLDVQTAFERGAFNRVPVIQGTNHDEGALFVALGHTLGLDVTAANYPTKIKATYGERFADRVLAQYPLASYQSPPLALTAAITDSTFACPALLSNRALAGKTTTFAYEFNDPNAALIVPLPAFFPTRSAHGSEMPYVMGRSVALKLPPSFSASQAALAETMQRYWTNFARSGTPSGNGVPAWPSITATGTPVQQLVPGRVGSGGNDFATDHKCGFWQSMFAEGLEPGVG
jgi:para-nitrobenzyl esterase